MSLMGSLWQSVVAPATANRDVDPRIYRDILCTMCQQGHEGKDWDEKWRVRTNIGFQTHAEPKLPVSYVYKLSIILLASAL